MIGWLYRHWLGMSRTDRPGQISKVGMATVYACVLFAVASVLTGDPIMSLITALTPPLAHTGPLHGESMDRGHSGGTWLGDSLAMTGRYAFWLLPLAWWTDLWFLPFGAIAVSVGYDIAYIGFRRGVIEQPTVWGEYWTGAVLEGVVILSLLTA